MSPSLSKMKELVDTAPGSLLVTDKWGKIVYVNSRVPRTTGYALPEIIGREPGRLWGGHMPKWYYTHLWETISEQKIPYVGHITNIKKSGESYEDTLSIAPLLDRSGEPEFFLALKAADISGRMEEELSSIEPGDTSRLSSVLGRFFQWLGIPQDRKSLGSTFSLSRFIRNTLVIPLEEKFSARLEDHELIRTARENPESFRYLYEKYHSLVFGYFLRHLSGDRALSEDLTQDTFFRAFRHLSQFQEGNAAYGTYLMRIAHNLLVNYYRREKTSTFANERVDAQAAEPPSSATFDDHSLDWLWNSRELTLVEREILTQFYHRGMSIREIALTHKRSENAVKLHLSRGRQKLRKLIGS